MMSIVTERGVNCIQAIREIAESIDDKEAIKYSDTTLQAVKGSYTASEQMGELLVGLKLLLPLLDERYPSGYSEEASVLIREIESLFRKANRPLGNA